jgi:hypothetical protein
MSEKGRKGRSLFREITKVFKTKNKEKMATITSSATGTPTTGTPLLTHSPTPLRTHDLNMRLTLGKNKFSVEDSLYELVTNAMDANEAKVSSAPPITFTCGRVSECGSGSSTIVVEDSGDGMAHDAFALGSSGPPRLHGFNGIGLKDAIVTLMREQATVTISSSKGFYTFDCRQGGLGSDTVHVHIHKPKDTAKVGTTVTISGLPSAAEVFEKARNRFLVFGKYECLGGTENVEVYESSSPVSFVFVNGVKKTVPNKTFNNVYNFKNLSKKQKLFITRDHTINKGFTRKHPEFLDPMERALNETPAAKSETLAAVQSLESFEPWTREFLALAKSTTSRVLISVEKWSAGDKKNQFFYENEKGKCSSAPLKKTEHFSFKYTLHASVTVAARAAAAARAGQLSPHQAMIDFIRNNIESDRTFEENSLERTWFPIKKTGTSTSHVVGRKGEQGGGGGGGNGNRINDQFENDLVASLYQSLERKNDPMFSLSSYENDAISKHTQDLVLTLQSLRCVSVAKIKHQGSMPKHTAIPGFVDVDIVVYLNNVEIDEASTSIRNASLFQMTGGRGGVQFLNSSAEVLQCIYKDINFDLVLNKSKDPTFNDGPKSVETLLEKVGPDCDYVFDVIRAGKYWVKRHSDVVNESNRIKSYQVEDLVLELHHSSRHSSATTTLQKKLQLFRDFLARLASPHSGYDYVGFASLAIEHCPK